MKVIEIEYENLPICHHCRKNYAEKRYEHSHKFYKITKNDNSDASQHIYEIDVRIPSCRSCGRMHLKGLFSISLPAFIASFYVFYNMIFTGNADFSRLFLSISLSLIISFVIFKIANAIIINLFYKKIRPKSDISTYHVVSNLLNDGWSPKN